MISASRADVTSNFMAARHIIEDEVEHFLRSRRSVRRSPATIDFYSRHLKHFSKFCKGQLVEDVEGITPDLIRLCLLDLGTHRNEGGVHAMWRTLKVFLMWYDREYEPEGWRNPIKKVDPPKLSKEVIPGVSPEDFMKMIEACETDFYGKRDKAILMFMFDTGVRVTELCDISMEDVDMDRGAVVIQHGKGNKPRYVFMASTCRREVMRYLRMRGDLKPGDPLFAHKDNGRFNRKGIEMMIKKVTKAAGLEKPPSPHDFRRAFTKQMLKTSDVVTVARLLGHSGTAIVWRYAHQDEDDLRDAHDQSSPLENIRYKK